MKKVIFVFIVIFFMLLLNFSTLSASENQVKAIYFYTPTCSSCQKLTSFFDDLQDKHKDFILIKYNITD
ncbi:thioredoxin domain-containing protein [Clostridium thermosuccinogenes]|uniref:thioredoxin domain-containing protein n=1 Tax=Clostridium thermosuccinogenes TaxID=84032 RepID=UPI000CCC404D|nr:thioredoxin domain-containing protein [Pseudoclostridium thermosuccinogenes]PNT93766.1 hypothetical protein CDQ83_09825 [Pseudoclostridium thermosuccinogenes]